MKWETFKNLSPMQQKEWEFRFGHKDFPHVWPHFMFYSISIMALVTSLMAFSYLIMKEYVVFKYDVLVLMQFCSMIMYYGVLIFFVDYIFEVVVFIWAMWKEYKWVKSLGVEYHG